MHYFAFEYSMVQKSFVLELTLATGSFTYEILCPLISRNDEMIVHVYYEQICVNGILIFQGPLTYLQNETVRVPLTWENNVCS